MGKLTVCIYRKAVVSNASMASVCDTTGVLEFDMRL